MIVHKQGMMIACWLHYNLFKKTKVYEKVIGIRHLNTLKPLQLQESNSEPT